MSHYVIRVEGRLSAGLVGGFTSMNAVQDRHTVLQGTFDDQSTVLGVVSRLRSLGLDVVEILRLPEQAEIRTSQTDAES